MSKIEEAAFNCGVVAFPGIAEAAAKAIRSAPDYRLMRDEFAAATLAALAEEGRRLLREPDADGAS